MSSIFSVTMTTWPNQGAAANRRPAGQADKQELALHANLLLPPDDSRLAFPIEDGCLPVPTGPGLGVSIDESRLGGANHEIPA